MGSTRSRGRRLSISSCFRPLSPSLPLARRVRRVITAGCKYFLIKPLRRHFPRGLSARRNSQVCLSIFPILLAAVLRPPANGIPRSTLVRGAWRFLPRERKIRNADQARRPPDFQAATRSDEKLERLTAPDYVIGLHLGVLVWYKFEPRRDNRFLAAASEREDRRRDACGGRSKGEKKRGGERERSPEGAVGAGLKSEASLTGFAPADSASVATMRELYSARACSQRALPLRRPVAGVHVYVYVYIYIFFLFFAGGLIPRLIARAEQTIFFFYYFVRVRVVCFVSIKFRVLARWSAITRRPKASSSLKPHTNGAREQRLCENSKVRRDFEDA